MIKYIVYEKPITMIGQKVQLQIKLPLNAKRLFGLGFSIRNASGFKNSFFGLEAGWVWLRDASKMDVFFSERILIEDNNFNVISPRFNALNLNNANPSQLPQNAFAYHGKQLHFFHLNKELTAPFIEGYYVDRLQSKITDYTLTTYLKIEV